jgi:hypothetical protein
MLSYLTGSSAASPPLIRSRTACGTAGTPAAFARQMPAVPLTQAEKQGRGRHRGGGRAVDSSATVCQAGASEQAAEE